MKIYGGLLIDEITVDYGDQDDVIRGRVINTSDCDYDAVIVDRSQAIRIKSGIYYAQFESIFVSGSVSEIESI